MSKLFIYHRDANEITPSPAFVALDFRTSIGSHQAITNIWIRHCHSVGFLGMSPRLSRHASAFLRWDGKCHASSVVSRLDCDCIDRKSDTCAPRRCCNFRDEDENPDVRQYPSRRAHLRWLKNLEYPWLEKTLTDIMCCIFYLFFPIIAMWLFPIMPWFFMYTMTMAMKHALTQKLFVNRSRNGLSSSKFFCLPAREEGWQCQGA